ncbi:hypothetical protein C8A05DRAFT_20363 [Staphylotrichum tortipilum]|uniref:Carboxylesterase type B domain-containing protein n=1 Tax=Staphylotrichum tortipilum TaxID=2831512 RepID=A0AAN6RNM5_9PEZI|nr:hypothetical protein C8A05DRAFT_20363 [Staphylotrichum longicolle]
MGLLGSIPVVATAAAAFVIGTAEGLYTGGGLTILSRNDLDETKNDGSAAVLVSHPAPFEAGRATCQALGEEPWNPDMADFTTTLSTSLGYQEYQKAASKGQLYWISKCTSCDSTCRAIDAKGKVRHVDCKEKLPTLCTQGAPVSTHDSHNKSANWQVQQLVGNKLLTGYRDYHVWKFRGIRYADTPERFTYSRVASFEDPGEVNATTAGADCSQPIGEVQSGSSEDCLFANVWTPYLPRSGGGDKEAKLRPVMLYLYGGGFTSGSGKNQGTDGTNLASRGDVVVVSINYRVGSIGFLNFNDGVHNGNYGISDMVTGLEWIHKYIKYLGGDPDNVTLFGESAGAYSTHVVLGVPKAKGLFHRAAMMSGPDGWPRAKKSISQPYYDDPETNYETVTKSVLEQAGCLDAADKVACLGKLDGFELVNLPTNAFGIVMDGTYLTNHELVVNSSSLSLATSVPVMFGFNRDETGIFASPSAYPTPGTPFTAYIDTITSGAFGPSSNISSLLGLDQYTPSDPFPGLPPALFNTTAATPAQVFDATIRLTTDWMFSCNNFAKAYSAAKHRAFKETYFFSFNRTYSHPFYTQPWCDAPATPARPHGDPDAEYLKCHGGEQMIVFATVARVGLPDRDGRDVKFMQLVVDYWAAFARWGDPNPEREWLRARGYEGTLAELETVGRWEAVEAERPTMRILQWGGKQVGLGEGHTEICEGLGAPLDGLEPN